MKKLIALFLSLCLVLGLCACAASQPAETTQPTETTEATTEATRPALNLPTAEEYVGPVTPLLFEVTDASGNTAWLFGSVHVGFESFYPLPDYVYDAFDQADAAAFEIDMLAFEADTEAQTAAVQAMMYTDGTTLKDHLPEELYNQAVQVMTDAGFYFELLDYYNVAMWSMLVEQLLYEEMGIRSDLGIDLHLMDKAYTESKPVYEVESALFQYQMMSNYSPALQEMLLQSAIESWGDPEAVLEGLDELVSCWATGDEAAMVALLAAEDDELTEEELVLYAEYKKAMETDRNIGMADYAEEALASGEKVFICVGAAHIVGEGGLVDLLTQRGYTVTCIGGTPLENAA